MAVVTGRPVGKAATGFRSIGTRPVRHDGVDKVTGRACYGADVFPGNLAYGAMLRSPHAHARIRSIDFSAALALPGVLAAVSASDLPQIEDHLAELGEGIDARISYKSQNMLAREKVLYDGHAIAAVAATDPHTAEIATRLIEVEYEPLEPLMSAAAAMAPGAPLIQPDVFTDHDGRADPEPSNVAVHTIVGHGDLDAGFAAASLVLEREFSTSTVHQGYIEPHNATARWLEDGQLEIWCSSQGAFAIRAELAELLDLSPARIRVHPDGDWRRIWRQAHVLPRTAGGTAGAQVRPAGEDDDEPRRRSARYRADLGQPHQGEDRRGRARHDYRRQS